MRRVRPAQGVSLADVPAEAALVYAGERADLVGQLAPMFRDLLTKEGLNTVYEDVELPLVPVLVEVERAGVRIDGPALAGQSHRLEQELALRTAQIYGARAARSKSIRPSSSRSSLRQAAVPV